MIMITLVVLVEMLVVVVFRIKKYKSFNNKSKG